MTNDEILARLTPEMPGGNEYWTQEQQAEQILPTVLRLLADELEIVAIAAEGCRNAPALIRAFASGFASAEG